MTTMKWRPIEEAPRDGTRVDVWNGHYRFADAAWTREDQDDYCWCHFDWHTTYDGYYWHEIDPQPTHFMKVEPPGGDDV